MLKSQTRPSDGSILGWKSGGSITIEIEPSGYEDGNNNFPERRKPSQGLPFGPGRVKLHSQQLFLDFVIDKQDGISFRNFMIVTFMNSLANKKVAHPFNCFSGFVAHSQRLHVYFSLNNSVDLFTHKSVFGELSLRVFFRSSEVFALVIFVELGCLTVVRVFRIRLEEELVYKQ